MVGKMRTSRKTVIMAILFAVSAFALVSELLMPTPIQIVIPGEEPIVVGQIFRYTQIDVLIISVSTVILAVSSLYLLFSDFAETRNALPTVEKNDTSELEVEIFEKKYSLEIVETDFDDGYLKDGVLKVVYFIKELTGIEQKIDIEIILYDRHNERIAETVETRTIAANSEQEFETELKVEEALGNNFRIVIDSSSPIYSSVVEETLVSGKPKITGSAIFGRVEGETIASIVLIGMFLIFAAYMIVRHYKRRKKYDFLNL